MQPAAEPFVFVSPETFERLAAENHAVHLERGADGRLVVTPPAGFETGGRNAELNRQLANWNARDHLGRVADSSAGFCLPNGAIRQPDASWTARERFADVARERLERFAPFAPDFAVELRSPSDSLPQLRAKLHEYVANGVRLAWLIDASKRAVEVYRPGQPVEMLSDPATVSADPVLPGFVLDVGRVFDPP